MVGIIPAPQRPPALGVKPFVPEVVDGGNDGERPAGLGLGQELAEVVVNLGHQGGGTKDDQVGRIEGLIQIGTHHVSGRSQVVHEGPLTATSIMVGIRQNKGERSRARPRLDSLSSEGSLGQQSSESLPILIGAHGPVEADGELASVPS